MDAGVAANDEILDRMDLVVAAGNGERDEGFDVRVLEQLGNLNGSERSASLNSALMTGLRPTLYLGELSNLLAGTFKRFRTFQGEETTLGNRGCHAADCRQLTSFSSVRTC
jgi:3-oxoacyl-[acyl-carrier-protein] synthase II